MKGDWRRRSELVTNKRKGSDTDLFDLLVGSAKDWGVDVACGFEKREKSGHEPFRTIVQTHQA
jgi:hypothetical protein